MDGVVTGRRRGTRKQIKIFRSRRKLSAHGNFGDEITIVILDRLFGIEAVPTTEERAELIGSGSILDRVWRQRRRLARRRSAPYRRAVDWLRRTGPAARAATAISQRCPISMFGALVS
jgi:hypothetical protein